tara:strand:+ start:553 stop:741 length:189 start_codon:yes stop_codon:yes gene_type:complete
LRATKTEMVPEKKQITNVLYIACHKYDDENIFTSSLLNPFKIMKHIGEKMKIEISIMNIISK